MMDSLTFNVLVMFVSVTVSIIVCCAVWLLRQDPARTALESAIKEKNT